jgi:hypothetical protein
MGPCRVVDADNGGVDDPKWSPGGFVDQWSQICITLMWSRIQIRIQVKGRIRIRNPALHSGKFSVWLQYSVQVFCYYRIFCFLAHKKFLLLGLSLACRPKASSCSQTFLRWFSRRYGNFQSFFILICLIVVPGVPDPEVFGPPESGSVIIFTDSDPSINKHKI